MVNMATSLSAIRNRIDCTHESSAFAALQRAGRVPVEIVDYSTRVKSGTQTVFCPAENRLRPRFQCAIHSRDRALRRNGVAPAYAEQ
jgi:hypothetical protein